MKYVILYHNLAVPRLDINYFSHLFHRTSGCEDPPVNHPGLLVQSLYNYVGDSEFPPVALDKWLSTSTCL